MLTGYHKKMEFTQFQILIEAWLLKCVPNSLIIMKPKKAIFSFSAIVYQLQFVKFLIELGAARMQNKRFGVTTAVMVDEIFCG